QNALPLLPSSAADSLSGLIGLATKLQTWATSAATQINSLSGAQTFKALVDKLKLATNPLGFTFVPGFKGAESDNHLEVLLNLDLNYATLVNRSLDFGAQAAALGLSIQGPAINVALNVSVQGHLGLGAT